MSPIDAFLALCATNMTAYAHASFLALNPGSTFHQALYIRALCHQLERIERGEIRRLLIILPPRHLKSHCASVVFPVWVLGRDPTKTVITASYGAKLSEMFSGSSRQLMLSELSRAIFPKLKVHPKKASLDHLLTTQNGGRIATSVGGPLTGTGGHFLIIDDPIKAEDVASETQRERVWDWFINTASNRFKVPNTGAIVVVAQRLHEDDLPGRLIATGEYEVFELPARETLEREIALPDGRTWHRSPGDILLPQHLGDEELRRIEREIGSAAYSAQYQQTPVPAGGNIIRPEWFRIYPSTMKREHYEAFLQSWDTASVPGESNDYSVCTTWGLLGNSIYLLDVWRSKVLYPQLRQAATKLRQQWAPNLIVIETMGVGQSLKADLRQADRTGVRGNTPRTDKVQRMSVQSARIEAGEVRLPESAPWKEQFLSEVAAFPNGKHDDQVDSMSQALFAIRCNPSELRHCSRYKG